VNFRGQKKINNWVHFKDRKFNNLFFVDKNSTGCLHFCKQKNQATGFIFCHFKISKSTKIFTFSDFFPTTNSPAKKLQFITKIQQANSTKYPVEKLFNLTQKVLKNQSTKSLCFQIYINNSLDKKNLSF
jgi:hypothetical protein